mgnify:CR=1 FL=1
MTKYYKKEIPEMPVYVNGTPLKFEVLETADPLLIAELDKCIQFSRGGVSEISAAEFEEESKKKQNATRSESGYKQQRQRQELSSQQLAQSLAAGAGSDSGAFRSQLLGPFVGPQDGRMPTPRNQFGLPSGTVGPSGKGPTPDPIEVPSGSEMKSKAPVAKLADTLV